MQVGVENIPRQCDALYSTRIAYFIITFRNEHDHTPHITLPHIHNNTQSPLLSQDQRKEQEGTQGESMLLSQEQGNQGFRQTAKSSFYQKRSWTRLTRTRGTSNLHSRYSTISWCMCLVSTGFSSYHGVTVLYMCMCEMVFLFMGP